MAEKDKTITFILSVISTNALTDDFFLYKVNSGEVIRDILEKSDNSIDEFLVYNPDIDLNKLDGKKIILRSEKKSDLCPRGADIPTPITYYQPQDQFLKSCLEKITKRIDVKIFEEKNLNKFDWKKFHTSHDYQSYIIYKLRLDLPGSLRNINNENFEDEAFINWEYYDIFYEALKQGYPDIQNFYMTFFWGWDDIRSVSLDESHERAHYFLDDRITAEEYLSSASTLEILNLPNYLKITMFALLRRELRYIDSVKADYFENLIQESIISGVKSGKKYISLDEFSLVYNANVDQEKLREHFCDGCSIEDIQQALPKNTQTFKSWVTEFVHLWELDEISFKEPEDQIYEDFAQSQIKSLKNLTQKLEDAYFPPLTDFVRPGSAGDYREWPIAATQYLISEYNTNLSRCDVAESEMQRSMRFHRTLDFLDWSWAGNDSLLTAPLELLDCYMRIESRNEEKFISILNISMNLPFF